MDTKQDVTRRELLRKAAYAAPAVLTLQAVSSVAKAGSDKHEDAKLGKKSKHKLKLKPEPKLKPKPKSKPGRP